MQNVHNLELAWLKDCMALAEKRHFSQAATIRYVTQSAFSRRIQSLEESVLCSSCTKPKLKSNRNKKCL